jgi:hypothetical protein
MVIIPASNVLALMMLLRRSPGGTLIIFIEGAMIRGKYSRKYRL